MRQVRENRATWEAIAHSFDATRNKPWAAVQEFVASLPRGARVLDAGCGNGRHVAAALERGLRVCGLDLSRALLLAARRRNPSPLASWTEGAIERPPFREASFDAVITTATLHHVRGRDERVAALRELLRLLQPGGRLLASGWTRDQPRFGPGREPRPPLDERHHEAGDAWVRWSQHGLQAERFTHLYGAGEWEEELRATGAEVERSWGEAIQTEAEPDNLFAILRRPRTTQ